MAYTASFYINNKRTKNTNCFFNFIHSNNRGYIIIEKSKQYYSKYIIEKYIDDIIKMGFNIKYSTNIIDGIRIYVNEDSMFKKKVICMLIRYLWEGHGAKTDRFYLIFDEYRKLRIKYPNIDLMMLMCAAHNTQLGEMDNSNHRLCYGQGCKIKNCNDVVTFNSHSDVNTFFSEQNGKLDIKKIKENKEKYYEQLFQGVE